MQYRSAPELIAKLGIELKAELKQDKQMSN